MAWVGKSRKWGKEVEKKPRYFGNRLIELPGVFWNMIAAGRTTRNM